MVLNEIDRNAKRELIEKNRERKSIEKIQLRIRRWNLFENSENEEFKQIIVSLTKDYCTKIDISLNLNFEFLLMDSNKQFLLLFKEILERTFNFVNEIDFFNKVFLKNI